jgi:heme-degrading monooxygenase HmoA
MADVTRLASFHLLREGRGRSAWALARLATDRRRLAGTDGLVFWRLMGTGRGNETGPSADLSRTALFAVWESPEALAEFRSDSPISRRWSDLPESWHVTLAAAGGHGTWRGVDPLDGLAPGPADGPVAVITRADVRLRSWRAFRASGRRVAPEVTGAAGLIDVVGIGEAPVGRLGTFSLWRDDAAIRAFVTNSPHHRAAVRSTRSDDWYSEELFARFRPLSSEGTWAGRDPLDGLL